MTGGPEPRFLCVVLHPLLDAPDGDRLPRTETLAHQEDSSGSHGGPHTQISGEGLQRIVAQVDHAILSALAVLHQDDPALDIDSTQGEMSHLFHPETATEHQHEDGPVAQLLQLTEEDFDLLVSQVPGKGPGHLLMMILFHRVGKRQPFLFPEVMIELADAVQVAVHRLGRHPLLHEVVDVARDGCCGYFFHGDIHPDYKMPDQAQIVLNGIGCAVAPLQKPPPVEDRIGQLHCSLPSR